MIFETLEIPKSFNASLPSDLSESDSEFVFASGLPSIEFARSPSLTLKVNFLPLRMTTNFAVVFGASVLTFWTNEFASLTFSPLISITTSPRLSPAFSAGSPLKTSLIIAPLVPSTL